MINFNIGLLGHVDSGKTSLAKVLSCIPSTAAFDKNPQSKERGITLDLGFSALQVEAPAHLKQSDPAIQQLQFTFVDCPGHASLIRTIIGGILNDLILFKRMYVYDLIIFFIYRRPNYRSNDFGY